MEFMAVVIVVLFFILAFYIVAFGKEGSAQQAERQQKLDSICNNVADRINNAVYYGFGFMQNYSLPPNIDGLNYTMDVGNKTLACKASIYSSIQTFIADSITNTTHNPPFFIPIREIKIENVLGTIVIS